MEPVITDSKIEKKQFIKSGPVGGNQGAKGATAPLA
jgi:hypothetical protein